MATGAQNPGDAGVPLARRGVSGAPRVGCVHPSHDAPPLAPGDGIFESVKVVEGRAFALDRHLARLFASARALGIAVAEDDVHRAVGVALLGCALPLGRLRVICSGAGDPGRAVVSVDLDPLPARTGPAAVVTAPFTVDERGPLTGHKTTAYADHVAALGYARSRGADEAVLANRRGDLCEATASNLFYVVDGELCTPSLASGCLPGITRALVLEWAGAREVDAPLELVREHATEVFLTSSTRDVQPVRRWDARELGAPGPVTLAVRQAWLERSGELLSAPM